MTCCICLENFLPKKLKQDKVALLVQCGHFYHQKCMNNWINAKKKGERSCPTCRTEVTYDMEIEVLPVELLIKNRKSILCLRQKHALRRKLQMLSEQQEQKRGDSESDGEDFELTSAEWVHISLHPMENSNPIAIQHSDSNTRTHRNRPISPFTIITPDEIPTRSEAETPPQMSSSQSIQNDFLSSIQDNIIAALPIPYLTPYDNWMTMR